MHRIAKALLRRVQLSSADGVGGLSELIDDDHREQDRRDQPQRCAEAPVQDDGWDLDLFVRDLGRGLDQEKEEDDDPEKAIDAAIRHLHAGRLLQDAARLQAQVRRGPHRHEQCDESDEAPDEAAEVPAHAVRDDEHDWKDVDPRHLALLPKQHAQACANRAGITL